MRVVPACVITLFVVISSARAQSDETTEPVNPVRTYSLLRENEDWSFLEDPTLHRGLRDPIKYIPLGENEWYLTIGGEIREVFEQVLRQLGQTAIPECVLSPAIYAAHRLASRQVFS